MKKLFLSFFSTSILILAMMISISAQSTCEHTFDSDGVIKEPTCQSVGYTTKSCTLCGNDVIVDKVEKSEHAYVTVSSNLDDATASLVREQECKWCGDILNSKVSLINKCYIQGYENEIYNATMEYFTVSADGVCTPNSNATWGQSVLYFPAYTMVNDQIVKVTTIQGFKKAGGSTQSIKEIYVPDTVTNLPYVGGGVFGDLNSLKVVVMGSGVTTVPRECFSIGNGCTLEKFIFKGLITSIGQHSFQQVGTVSGFDSNDSSKYEFNTNLTYIGNYAFAKSNVIRTVKLAPSITYIGQCAFNDANYLHYVYISGGTKENPVVLPMDIFSTNVITQMTMVIDGYVVSGARAVIQDGKLDIYVDSIDVIKTWVATAVAVDSNYNSRFSVCKFMICSEEQAYQVTTLSQNYDEIVVSKIEGYKHAKYTDVIVTDVPTCTESGSQSIVNRCCGKTVTETLDAHEHNYNGGIITVDSTCTRHGTLTYTCQDCGYVATQSVGFDASLHAYDKDAYVDVVFTNYLEKGMKKYVCEDCGQNTEENAPSFDALFIKRGYSVDTYGKGIVFSIQVNTDAIQKYNSLGKNITYGVFVSLSSNPIIDNMTASDDSVVANMTNTPYTILQIKLLNIDDENLDTDVYCSAYVIDGGKIKYINDVETTDSSVGVNYNAILN